MSLCFLMHVLIHISGSANVTVSSSSMHSYTCLCICLHARVCVVLCSSVQGAGAGFYRVSFNCSVLPPLTASTMSVIGSYMTECMQSAPVPLLSVSVVLSRTSNTDWQANMHLILYAGGCCKVWDSVEGNAQRHIYTHMAIHTNSGHMHF